MKRTVAPDGMRPDPYDDRPFKQINHQAMQYAAKPPAHSGTPLLFCTAHPITDRLAIQRGHFLLGPVREDEPTSETTLAGVKFDSSWVNQFLDCLGKGHRPPKISRPMQGDAIVVFHVPGGAVKERPREWIEPRSGFTPELIYPPAWHEPHLEAWS